MWVRNLVFNRNSRVEILILAKPIKVKTYYD